MNKIKFRKVNLTDPEEMQTIVHCKNEAMLALNKNLDYEIFGYKLKKKL